jgi:hypothetical protein
MRHFAGDQVGLSGRKLTTETAHIALLAFAIEISALFLLAEPNPDPAPGVVVQERDPGLLEG